MTGRVQADVSWMTMERAEDYHAYMLAYLEKHKDELYVPTEDDVKSRPDLWTGARLTTIKDYDDEGKNKGGETVKTVIITPKKVEKYKKIESVPFDGTSDIVGDTLGEIA